VTPVPETPLDFATIASTPALWPKQVALVKQTTFPLMLNGKVVGQAQVPVGTVLPLLRVLPDPTRQQVEVLHQNSREIVPAASIDLIPRASALKNTVSATTPVLEAPVKKIPAPVAPALTAGPKPGTTDPLRTKAEFESRITVSAMRGKSTKIEGGDFDDKRDRITFTIRFRNADPNRPSPGLHVEFYVFGQSLVNLKAVKLLQKYDKSLDLAPLQDMEFVTPEAVTEWDNTGSIFGSKYKGWYLFVRNAAGEVVLEKNSVPFLETISGLPKTTVGLYYNKKLEPMTVD